MNEDEIPLEVRPGKETPAASPALCEAIEPEAAPSLEAGAWELGMLWAPPEASPPSHDLSSMAPGTSESPTPGLSNKAPEKIAGSDPAQGIFSETSSPSFGVMTGPAQEGNGPDSPDGDLPLRLSPTVEPRPIAEVPKAGQRAAAVSSESSRAPGPFGVVVLVASITLAGLYLARTITRWGGELAAFHPALAYALYGSVGVLLGMLVWSMARQV